MEYRLKLCTYKIYSTLFSGNIVHLRNYSIYTITHMQLVMVKSSYLKQYLEQTACFVMGRGKVKKLGMWSHPQLVFHTKW